MPGSAVAHGFKPTTTTTEPAADESSTTEIRYEPGTRLVVETSQLPSSDAGIDAKWYRSVTSRSSAGGVTTEYATLKCFVDLAGSVAASSGGTANDIIGQTGIAASLGRYTTATMGTLLGGTMECYELPVDGGTDIDLIADDTAGQAGNAAAALPATVLNSGGWALGDVKTLDVAAIETNDYLYLTEVGGTDAVYSAGKFLLTFYCQFTVPTTFPV
jgi:hypothetical protein